MIRMILLSTLCFLLLPARSPAQADPPLGWKELLKCELVIVAKYKAHEQGELSLHVVEVLRGTSCKPGDVLLVKLGPAFDIKLNARSVSIGFSGARGWN